MPDSKELSVERFNLEVLKRGLRLTDISTLAEIKEYLVERIHDFEDDWLTGLWGDRLLDIAAVCLTLWLMQDEPEGEDGS